MATEIKLPQLGQTMEEGTIVSCLVKVGDEIKKGDVLFEIETDKATLEMESPVEGFVKHITAEVGQTLAVGDVMMVVGAKDEEVAAPGGGEALKSQTEAEKPAPVKAEKKETAGMAPASPVGAERIVASPRAKKAAKEKGVDLSKVKGSGPGGRITAEDVEKAAGEGTKAAVPATQKRGEVIPLNRLQKITAERMVQSKQEIPCYYLTCRVDMTELVSFREKINADGDVKVAYNDFIIKAMAKGLEEFPFMTGQFEGENIRLAEEIGIGLAISVEEGLVAPIVKEPDKKDVRQIARDTQGLIERARSNKLSLEDLSGGCTTVSNLGAFGIEAFTPVVVPGQCSILGIGEIREALEPLGGNILVRKMMNMTLSVDHKVVSGAYAGRFLDYVKKVLEEPSNFE